MLVFLVIAVVVIALAFLELAVWSIAVAMIGGIGLIVLLVGRAPMVLGIAVLTALGVGIYAFVRNSPGIAARINALGVVKREVLAGDVVVGSLVAVVALGVVAQFIGSLF